MSNRRLYLARRNSKAVLQSTARLADGDEQSLTRPMALSGPHSGHLAAKAGTHRQVSEEDNKVKDFIAFTQHVRHLIAQEQMRRFGRVLHA